MSSFYHGINFASTPEYLTMSDLGYCVCLFEEKYRLAIPWKQLMSGLISGLVKELEGAFDPAAASASGGQKPYSMLR